MRFLALALCLLPMAAHADYRFEEASLLDHRGLWGIELATGPDWSTFSTESSSDLAWAPAFDLRLSRAVSDRGEVAAGVRLALPEDGTAVRLEAGWRSYFGLESVKTFADAGVLVSVSPEFSAGGRLGVGAMWDPNRRFGLLARGGAWVAGGPGGTLLGFDLRLGAQLRF